MQSILSVCLWLAFLAVNEALTNSPVSQAFIVNTCFIYHDVLSFNRVRNSNNPEISINDKFMTLPLVKSQSLYDVSVCGMYYVRVCGMYDVRVCGMYNVRVCEMYNVRVCGMAFLSWLTITFLYTLAYMNSQWINDFKISGIFKYI